MKNFRALLLTLITGLGFGFGIFAAAPQEALGEDELVAFPVMPRKISSTAGSIARPPAKSRSRSAALKAALVNPGGS